MKSDYVDLAKSCFVVCTKTVNPKFISKLNLWLIVSNNSPIVIRYRSAEGAA